MSPIHRIYERLTGRPWMTTRSMAAEFGDPPAVRFPALAELSDTDWLRLDMRLLVDELEALRATTGQLPPEVRDAAERLMVRVIAGRVTGDDLRAAIDHVEQLSAEEVAR